METAIDRAARTVARRQVFLPITPAHRRVLALICIGMGQEEAGSQLGISFQTVKNHLAEIRWRMQARTTAQVCFEVGREICRKEGT